MKVKKKKNQTEGIEKKQRIKGGSKTETEIDCCQSYSVKSTKLILVRF